MVIIVPMFERQAAGVYRNSAAVIDADGALLGVYRKMHIPDDPLFYEKYYFTPGDATQDERAFPGWQRVPRLERVRQIGVLICWDQWYPEAARITSLLGADILFYPTAIGWHPSEKAEFGAAQVEAWRTVQRGHAIANGVYVAAANRVGHEPEPGTDGLEFFGHSFVSDPFGRIIADGGTTTRDADRAVRHRGASRTRGAIGRSCATGASTPTGRSSSGTSDDDRAVTAYRMPAEWEPHAATWIAWPHHEPDWPGKLAPIPWVYAEIVRALAPHERVDDPCQDEPRRDAGADRSTAHGVRRGAYRLSRRSDRPRVAARLRADRVVSARRHVGARPLALQRLGQVRQLRAGRRGRRGDRRASPACQPSMPQRPDGKGPLVLEGGAIDINGEGLLLDDRRVPAGRRPGPQPRPRRATDTSSCFRDYLGVRQTLWLGARHAPATTRTAMSTTLPASWRPDIVVLAYEPDPEDDNHEPSEDNLRRLRACRRAMTARCEVVTLPYAAAGRDERPAPAGELRQLLHRQRRGRSCPTFNDPNDRVALATLAELFPDHQVVGIHAVDLVWGLGTLHCLTQQQPASGAAGR